MITIGVLAYIPTARHRELLERTLASLAVQIGAPRFQTVLVDNGNVDGDGQSGTSKWLEALAQRYGALYVRRENREIAAARDLVMHGESYGEARFVGFVDSDVEVPPGWVASMVAELDRDLDLVAVASSNRPPRGESAFEEALGALFQVPWNYLGSPQALQQTGGFRDVDHLSSCAVLYRREAVFEVGGYDSRFTVVCEDLELSRRLRQVGKLRLLGVQPVIHRQDRGEFGWWRRMYRYGWGQIEVMRKHPDTILSLKGALVPLFFVGGYLARKAAGGDEGPFFLALSLYLLLSVGGVFVCNRSRSLAALLRASVLTIGTHVAYVLGMLAGVTEFGRNPPSATPPSDA